MLPNLSRLSLVTNTMTGLFEHVARSGGGKKGCITHSEDLTVKLNENSDYNCAIDGYLMFKTLEGAADEGVADPRNYSGKEIAVQVEGATVALQPLMKRSNSWKDRKSTFKLLHSDWIDKTFPILCSRGPGLGTVSWENYGDDLAKVTEWYFLDKDNQHGHLFLQLLDTPEYKQKMHMPAYGAFEGRYLYVALVCAGGDTVGYGKYLMKVAEAACHALGCKGIALASLSNAAGFYYSLGFQFVSRVGGQPLDVSAWEEVVELNDGRLKTMLRTGLRVDREDPSPPSSTAKRGRYTLEVEEEEEEEEEAGANQLSLFGRIIKAARTWTPLSLFSSTDKIP